MSDNWDVYFTTINDHFASILLDMGISGEAPDLDRPCLLYVWIKLNAPDEHGMISDQESESIHLIEDALAHEIGSSVRALHVGCVTREGRRELYFYGRSARGLQETVQQVMESIGTHRWMCDSKDDPGWEHYLQLMYPTSYDMQMMKNRQVVQLLYEEGDTLEKERTVFHWAYFSGESSRAQFINAIRQRGYSLDNELLSDTPEDPYPFGVSFQRADHVDWNSINDVTIELLELVDSLEGNYDGWETSVEKD
ncbi:DUF695 domain-containing protein [Blastopirellula marina]|uniref:DUF695 domain-containing protein n=1 Tax=Blastopirellula marina TaxID=124 RepID=A0A2S8F598_9BACT|nr:DUF695 domain-containing protein [Blastopirellula marina]PQO27104.1 hypothetical protein C5Y98_28040 [Blastopirellula marina]PTL41251.1 hypothetical protein C5Y97_28055 [Blastopirellula marina]